MSYITDIPNSQSAPNWRPKTIRLPASGQRCPYTGLSRSSLNNLILPCLLNGFKPPVKSYALRRRNAIRGVRLICYDSLMQHLFKEDWKAA